MSYPKLQMSNLELPMTYPEFPISNPELPISNLELPISNPELPISNPKLPISNPFRIVYYQLPINLKFIYDNLKSVMFNWELLLLVTFFIVSKTHLPDAH